jgi:peptide/nickel transport system ATP-binding protein
VSFDVHQSEAIAVVGESGCGKSSLMKTILGLNHPTEGKVSFQGKDISEFGVSELKWYRSQVGYDGDPWRAAALWTYEQSRHIIIAG